jgi:hypothetical protein
VLGGAATKVADGWRVAPLAPPLTMHRHQEKRRNCVPYSWNVTQVLEPRFALLVKERKLDVTRNMFIRFLENFSDLFFPFSEKFRNKNLTLYTKYLRLFWNNITWKQDIIVHGNGIYVYYGEPEAGVWVVLL